MSYCNYKPFCGQTFESLVSKKLEKNTSMDFEALKTLYHHYTYWINVSLLKKKYPRANRSILVTKELSKAIMSRSRLTLS